MSTALMTYVVSYISFDGGYASKTVKAYNEDDLADIIREIECFEGHVTGYRRIR